ncbi:hypothetical protein BO70DRAFT_9552 [Aspergillus heteromorphus CBS 117.55]|uniref:Uncharacterized protein n=1 Tax=Aspergillus heteromorphus CBS 117.55 TaxID=1448321 RepID=A0A317X178_9EURO|nr:uncharacterized protein BO70DRAFT_9552 [Aspergillus heteromorphus CBS 117.55]PWY92419.1 hypothetical protein BO70DRAFT_9552 [Aspergillus heteromorphus CBS 117.55]
MGLYLPTRRCKLGAKAWLGSFSCVFFLLDPREPLPRMVCGLQHLQAGVVYCVFLLPAPFTSFLQPHVLRGLLFACLILTGHWMFDSFFFPFSLLRNTVLGGVLEVFCCGDSSRLARCQLSV